MKYDSRYQDGEEIIVPRHDYDAVGNVEKDFTTDQPFVEYHTATYLLTSLPLPDPPPYQEMVGITDNLPLYAQRMYDDSFKWWIVAEANPHIRHPLDLKMGDLIYLP